MYEFDNLRPHVGHTLTCCIQSDTSSDIEDSITLECESCGTVIMEFDKEDEDECEGRNVWLLNISHPFGTDFYIFQTSGLARDQVYEYVFRNWAEDFPGEPIPEDRDRAIDEYFDGKESEGYTIQEQPVLCEVEK